jgi:hypothetical protein
MPVGYLMVFPFHEDLRNAYSSLYFKVGYLNLWRENSCLCLSVLTNPKVALVSHKFLDFAATKTAIFWVSRNVFRKKGHLYRTAQHQTPEDCTIQSQFCDNKKSFSSVLQEPSTHFCIEQD